MFIVAGCCIWFYNSKELTEVILIGLEEEVAEAGNEKGWERKRGKTGENRGRRRRRIWRWKVFDYCSFAAHLVPDGRKTNEEGGRKVVTRNEKKVGGEEQREGGGWVGG